MQWDLLSGANSHITGQVIGFNGGELQQPNH